MVYDQLKMGNPQTKEHIKTHNTTSPKTRPGLIGPYAANQGKVAVAPAKNIPRGAMWESFKCNATILL